MKPSEILRHLTDFADDPEDVATMTPEQIRAELEAEGVDVADVGRKLAAVLRRHRGGVTIPADFAPCCACGSALAFGDEGKTWISDLAGAAWCLSCARTVLAENAAAASPGEGEPAG